MNLRQSASMDSGLLPERPGEPDCDYFLKTGLCRFGMTCKFNHPPHRKLAPVPARTMGGYPERIGQPECQYYLKTGKCIFGATCKFHHPKDKAGIVGRVQLNILGYPLHPNEKACGYYLRTGQCKFGSTCKFDHPQPHNTLDSLRDSPVYPSVQSPTTPSQQSQPGTPWSISRTFIPSTRWQGTSSCAPGLLGSISSPLGQKQSPGTFSQYYGISSESEASAGSQGRYPYPSSSVHTGLHASPRENVFPERPSQPECQFYMKTSDCKFGAMCRFHHPRERFIPVPNFTLSPMGLPLRPGVSLCVFYSRYGICKFGPNCKFDHPMGISTANALSLGPPSSKFSEGPVENRPGNSTCRRSSSEPLQLRMSPGEGDLDEDDPHT